ncbi:MAG: hypothetical protein ACYC6M_07535 [Terriglobales bacterium]
MDVGTLFDGREFDVHGDIWIAKTTSTPNPCGDRRCIDFVFRKPNGQTEIRHLKLWVSHTLLNDPTKRYQQQLALCIRGWLSASEKDGEKDCVKL